MKKNYSAKSATCLKKANTRYSLTGVWLIAFLLLSISTSAFKYTITGKVLSKNPGDVWLQCYLSSELIQMKPDSSGKFYYEADLTHPSQMLISFAYAKKTFRYNFYLFNDSRLTVTFDPLKKGNEWQIDGLCARCKAFEKITPLSDQAAKNISPVNYAAVLSQLNTQIKQILGIGTDEYTQLMADMHSLRVKENLFNPATGKILFNTADDPLLKKYLPAKEKYCGFSLYVNYLSTYQLQHLYDSVINLRIKDGSLPEPILIDVLRALKKQKNTTAPAVYNEMLLQLIYANRDPAFKDSLTKAAIRFELQNFIAAHPRHSRMDVLKKIADQYAHPLLRNQVPENIWMLSRRGQRVPTQAYKSKLMVLNIWSPANKLSRSLCDSVEAVIKPFKKDYNIYVNHIALWANERTWITAPDKDSLPGIQLMALSPETFESAFQIWDFPVTYIIHPDGRIIYKGHPYSLTPDFMKKVLEGKLN